MHVQAFSSSYLGSEEQSELSKMIDLPRRS